MNILFLMKGYAVGGIEVVTATLASCFARHGRDQREGVYRKGLDHTAFISKFSFTCTPLSFII